MNTGKDIIPQTVQKYKMTSNIVVTLELTWVLLAFNIYLVTTLNSQQKTDIHHPNKQITVLIFLPSYAIHPQDLLITPLLLLQFRVILQHHSIMSCLRLARVTFRKPIKSFINWKKMARNQVALRLIVLESWMKIPYLTFDIIQLTNQN